MKELNFDWLLNGSCLLSDVAMAYFTTCVYPRSAGKRMRDEIERYPNLYAELLEAGYKRPSTLLTPGPKRQHTWTSRFVVNSGECPVRRIGFKNCSPTANSTDIFYISFVYYLFMCRSACWRPLNSSAQKAEQQRIRSTKACWCPCWWFRGSG